MDQDFQAGKEGLEYMSSKNMGTAIMEPLRGGCLTHNIPSDIQAIWNRAETKRSLAEGLYASSGIKKKLMLF